jgi:hypothetical protein
MSKELLNKTKLIKNINDDLDDIDYIKRNYDFDNLDINEIQEIYSNLSMVWLILHKAL